MLPRVVALLCGLAAASAAACAKPRAAETPVMPTLAPPEVPPRVVAEYLPDPPLPAEPVAPDAVTPPPRPARPPRREPPRTEPVDEPQGPPPSPAPAAPQGPPLMLQTPASNAAADQSVRTLLARAARDLGRVEYQTLDADGKAQYDTARRFMQQADDALKARNVMFAGKLADKAAAMAAVLVR
jgi:hypothetical protein